MDNMLAKGYEGAILKNIYSIYRPGKRSKDWLKMKQCNHVSLDVFGYIPPTSDTEYGVIMLRDSEEKGERMRKIVTTVKVPNLEMRSQFLENWEQFNGRRAIIAYQDITLGGHLRHPRFDRWWDE